jgi:ribosomal protein S12 methylthiotransferase accessory factor
LGTHRVRQPEETWEAVAPLLARAGVTRVAEVTALDRIGVPVYQAIRPASRNLSVSQGKGLTAAAARVSAVMEALELWHAERLDGLPQVTASLREMEYANPVRPGDLPWVEGAVGLDAAPMAWVPALSLVSGRRAWLPRELLEVDFTVPETLRPRMLYVSSNGLASGNCREEAQLHALCEVVERHGLHRARERPEERAALDPESVDDPECRRLIERFGRTGMKLGIFDVTWEAGVASFLVELVAADLPNVWMGAGTHPSRSVALARALTEAAQSRLAYISGARDDLPRLCRGAGYHRTFDGYRPPVGRRRFSEVPDLATDSVARDLEAVVERVAAAGHEPFWVDLTRPEVGLAVVRVFVPGWKEMRHH